MKRFWWVLFLLLIPTQLGKHFWFDWSSVLGIRIDYLAPTLYGTDLVWLGLVVVSCQLSDLRKIKKYWWIGVLAVINILVAANKWAAGYEWIRIIQWLVTIKLIRNEKLRIANYLKWILPIWMIGESLLGLGQMINGGSFQGIFYWLGERRFSLTTVGIATWSWMGEGMLRAYGTFSHPNSMAGFLIVSWWWWQEGKSEGKNIWYWVAWWMGLLGIVISGSRTVWLITGIILIFNLKFIIYNWKKKAAYLAILGGVVMMLVGVIGENYHLADFIGGWDSESFNKRVELVVEAGKLIMVNPLLGVGAGNFLNEKVRLVNGSSWIQPVHNIFLLGWVELGLIPLAILIYNFKFLIYKIIKDKRNWVWLRIILVTGMVDHYWVTLAQNRWLVGILIGVMAGQIEGPAHTVKKKIQ